MTGKTGHDTPMDKEMFRTVFEETGIGIELYDSAGSLLELNKACCEIFGVVDPAEAKGFKLFDDPNLSDDLKERLRNGETVSYEVPFDFEKVKERKLYRTSKSGVRFLEVQIGPLKARNERAFSGYLVQIQDLTERKFAEEALKEVNTRLSALIDAIPDMIVFKDTSGRHLLTNKAVEKYTGVRREEVIGKTAEEILPPDLAAYCRKSDEEALKSRLPLHFEEQSMSRDGQKIFFDTIKGPIYDRFGAVAGLVGVSRDITTRKRAEEKLAEKTSELERSNVELEHFASVVSHDLKEPLVSIGGFAELLLEQYNDKLDAKGRGFLTHIYNGTIRLELMISDLLAYARVSTSSKPFAPVNVNSVLGVVLSNLRSAIEESNAVITFDALPTITGDETQFVQLFQNLIVNAIKYRDEAPPRIHISARPIAGCATQSETATGRAVPSPHSALRSGWLFSVNDNGIGIAPHHFERIFEIFGRLHHGEKYPGTGIGLAVCKKIVERRGGRIWVESEPGKGSTFFFTIP